MSSRATRLVLFIAVASVVTAGAIRAAQLVERTVYVSVLDRSGRPVRDVVAEQLTVLENNTHLEVIRVSPVTDPFDIAVLVDTSADAERVIPDIRRGLVELVRALGDRHEVAVIGFGQRPTTLVDYTRDPKRLEAGIGRIFAQTGSGAYLMDAIVEASRGLRAREHARRQLVIITTESPEFSNRHSSDVLAEVSRSSAVFDAFVIVNSSPVSTAAGTDTLRQSPSTQLPDQAEQERAFVLTEAPRMTRGRREDLVTGMALGTRLRDFAAGFNQYSVVFEGPPRTSPAAPIEVLTTRPELRVEVRAIG